MKTVRLSETALRGMVKKIVAEQATGAGDPVARAAKMIVKAGPYATKGETERACKILARAFADSPTPAQDIAAALESYGVDPGMALDIGDTCETEHMGGGYGGGY